MPNRTNTPRRGRVMEPMGDHLGFAKRVARKFGLTLAQAQALIIVVGTDLAKLTEAAERLRQTPRQAP